MNGLIFFLLKCSLQSKCFRGVGEQRKTKERNRNGILPARNWGESQNKKEGVGEGKEGNAYGLKTSVRQRTELVSCWTSQTLLTRVDHRIKKGKLVYKIFFAFSRVQCVVRLFVQKSRQFRKSIFLNVSQRPVQ